MTGVTGTRVSVRMTRWGRGPGPTFPGCASWAAGAGEPPVALVFEMSSTAAAAGAPGGRRVSGTARHVQVDVHAEVRGEARQGCAPLRDLHLRADTTVPGPPLPLADVLVRRGGSAREAAVLRTRHPGALVVAVSSAQRCWLRLAPGVGCGHEHERGRERAAEGITLELRACPVPGLSWAAWASLAHAWLVAGLPAEGLRTATGRIVPPPRPTPRENAPAPGVTPPREPSPGLPGPPGEAPWNRPSREPRNRRRRPAP
ncbi:hypothetical protein GCM10027091_00310 [Streptomyces daliensis]